MQFNSDYWFNNDILQNTIKKKFLIIKAKKIIKLKKNNF